MVENGAYTDDATLAIVERVLAGDINEGLAKQIQEYGGKAQSLNFRTTNVLFGERLDAAWRKMASFGRP